MTQTHDLANSARRKFLKHGALAGVALGLAATGGDVLSTRSAKATARYGSLDAGDAAILRFLAAAELIEHDLWQQYAELGENNPRYKEALEGIDDDMVDYAVDVTEDELSHHQFINAFLDSKGADPVNLDEFRTIPPPNVTGIQPAPRLTNLRKLSVDTSYYFRYRRTGNPDFGDTFPQIATIIEQPGIPTSDGLGERRLGGIARVATFHFASIEVGGTSLYDSFLTKATSPDVLRIVGSIYATEAIHYAIFEDTFGGITHFQNSNGTLVVPDLTEGKHGSEHVMPKRCVFLSRGLPTCSVIRPSSTENGGALAALKALRASNLFDGQSPKFFRTMHQLATAADAAVR
jgi:ferritin-like protein